MATKNSRENLAEEVWELQGQIEALQQKQVENEKKIARLQGKVNKMKKDGLYVAAELTDAAGKRLLSEADNASRTVAAMMHVLPKRYVRKIRKYMESPAKEDSV